MIFLVDHNLEGHALLLSGRLTNQGWLDLLPIGFVFLEEVGLPVNSSDRVIIPHQTAIIDIALMRSPILLGIVDIEYSFLLDVPKKRDLKQEFV